MRSWVRAPSLRPRRNKLHIACSDFCKAERTRSAVPPFSNRKRFAGLRFDVRRGRAILHFLSFSPAPQRVICGNTAPSPSGLRHQTLTLRFAGSNPAGAATGGDAPALSSPFCVPRYRRGSSAALCWISSVGRAAVSYTAGHPFNSDIQLQRAWSPAFGYVGSYIPGRVANAPVSHPSHVQMPLEVTYFCSSASIVNRGIALSRNHPAYKACGSKILHAFQPAAHSLVRRIQPGPANASSFASCRFVQRPEI